MEPLKVLERSRFGFESLTLAAEGKMRFEQSNWRQGFRQHDLSGSFQSGSSRSLQGRQGELWAMEGKVGQELAGQLPLTELSGETANSKQQTQGLPVCRARPYLANPDLEPFPLGPIPWPGPETPGAGRRGKRTEQDSEDSRVLMGWGEAT